MPVWRVSSDECRMTNDGSDDRERKTDDRGKNDGEGADMPSDVITPSEIFAEVEALPPLMRPRFAEKYLGVEVDWPVRFADAWEKDAEMLRVAFHLEVATIQAIMGEVRRSEHPQLERLHAREPLRVHGRIRRVERLSIELDITELVFCVEAEPVSAL